VYADWGRRLVATQEAMQDWTAKYAGPVTSS